MKTLEELNNAVARLNQLAKETASASLLREIEELSEKLTAEKFYLVVVGLFKRGKSSLINALLDKSLAPVAVTPLTAIITLFEYGADSFAEIHFTDGRVERIGINGISSFVTEDENPDNIKLVSFVRIYTNIELLKQFTLIDTPGLGSVLEHNTLATQSFIPKIDAALFVLSTDVPVSKEDVELLKTLKEHKTKTLFVLNKADMLGDSELQKILQYNRQTITKTTGNKQVELMPVSGKEYFINKQSSSHGITILRIKIGELISQQKDTLLLAAGCKQCISILTKVETTLRLKIEILQSPVQELRLKQEALNRSVKAMNESEDEFRILIKGRIQKLQNYIHEEVNQWSRELEKDIEEEIIHNETEIFHSIRENMPYQMELINRIISELDSLKRSLEIETKKNFKTLLENYSQQSQSFISELSNQLHALMHVNFDQLIGTFDLDIYTAFYFRTQPDIQLPNIRGNVWYRILPERMVQKSVIKQLRQNIKELIVTNSAATIYDLQYRIQESFRKFNYDLNNRLKELLENIDSTIQRTIEEKSAKGNALEADTTVLQVKLEKLMELKQQVIKLND